MAVNGTTRMRFRTVQQFGSDYCSAKFTQYESERTGMRVITVDQKGPKVYGYFALATEIHDDSGAPHTLEHLVFMGSRSFKYKGFLDRLANRAYSDTNAWTDTDNTVYTLEAAGWDGFNMILPVYLEHVILPTLTDAGCYTEVHHVDGTGRDAGVVYSEMQGTQNTSSQLMDLEAKRLIYPETLGFRYETGGLMEALRVLTANRIREFHRDMYQPKNLALISVGEIDHEQLLHTLDKFEDTIMGSVPRLDEPFNRPWEKTGKTPVLEKTTVQAVEFPEEDESMGEILICYLGPDCNDNLLSTALSSFLVYICGSSISLLENVLVEEEQLASAVYYETRTRPDILIEFTISGVETECLDMVQKRFCEVLEDAASKPLDMEYMHECIHRGKRQIKFISEETGRQLADEIIYDHLFGNRDGSNLRGLATLKEYDTLLSWTEKDWKEFFQKWFINANHITILGKPSKSLAETMEKEEQDRVARQQEKLGEEGLKKLATRLEDAKGENDGEIPTALLREYQIPSTDSIHFITTTSARAGLAKQQKPLDNDIQKHIDAKDCAFPAFLHFEHIDTKFVSVGVVMCTQTIPEDLRPLLAVYVDNFFNTPVVRRGVRQDYEDVVSQLEKDSISYNIGFGDAIGNPELLLVNFQVEPHKYGAAIEWIKTLLFDSIFDQTRLESAIVKILASIPEEKRSGSDMAHAVSNLTHMAQKSTTRATNTLVKSRYFKRTLATLRKNPEKITEKFERVRQILAQVSNFRCFAVADVLALKDPVSEWLALTKDLNQPNPHLDPLDSYHAVMSAAGQKPGNLAYIVPMRTSDSSYAVIAGRGVDSYNDPRLPALAVAQAFLEAVEGPLWVAVRGTGLAYGTSFVRSVSRGLMFYSIYRSPDAHNAFVASKQTISDFVTGKTELDDLALEGAISSIVTGVANEQPSMFSAAEIGFSNQVIKGIPKTWGIDFMKEVRGITKEKVRDAMRTILLPIFEPASSNLFVTCATVMEEKLIGGFKEEGYQPESRTLGSFEEDYGLEREDGDDQGTDLEDELTPDEDETEDEEEDDVEDE